MTEEHRATAYPLIIHQPLGSYVENYDIKSRYTSAKAALEALIRDVCGVSVVVAVIDVAPGNDDEGRDTWNTAVLAARFTNITRSELEKYRDHIADAVTFGKDEKPKRRLLNGPDFKDLPTPDVFIPTTEWIEENLASARSRAESAKKLLDENGNPKKVAPSAPTTTTTTTTTTSTSAPAGEEDGRKVTAADLF